MVRAKCEKGRDICRTRARQMAIGQRRKERPKIGLEGFEKEDMREFGRKKRMRRTGNNGVIGSAPATSVMGMKPEEE